MSILKLMEQAVEEDSIIEYEVHEFEPIVGTNLNNPSGEIRFDLNAQTSYVHPSESYLIFVGELVKGDGTVYNNANNISLTNYGLMYLFKSFIYKLNGTPVEEVYCPGQTTTMLGLLKYTHDFSKSQGLNQLWYKDTGLNADNTNTGFEVRRRYILRDSVPVGTFSFKVPLKHIFGFCEDYNKVIYGMRHNLTLVRNNDTEAIFRSAQDAAGNPLADGKVNLIKISWYVPYVLTKLSVANELIKIVEKKEEIPIQFRKIRCEHSAVDQATSFTWNLSADSSETPRYIIFGFQTNRLVSQEVNSALFDNLRLKNLYIFLDAVRYPAIDYNLDFTANQFARAYGDAASFRSKFLNTDELVSNLDISPAEYQSLFLLFVVNMSKQIERLKNTSFNMLVKMFFEQAVAAQTEVYAIIISDRSLILKSDGTRVFILK